MRFSLIAFALALAGAAHASPQAIAPAAEAHLRRGQALYDRGDYAGAIAEFERGRAIEADPAFLYGLGQAERKRGDCRKAIEHYTAFLAAGPPELQERAARLQITRCQAELTARARAPAAPVLVREPLPWYRDLVGDALVVGGLAVGTAGALVARGAQRDIDRAGDSYPDLAAAQDAPGRRTAGLVAAGAGVALVAAGLLHYALWRPTRQVALEPRAGGAAVSLRVAF